MCGRAGRPKILRRLGLQAPARAYVAISPWTSGWARVGAPNRACTRAGRCECVITECSRTGPVVLCRIACTTLSIWVNTALARSGANLSLRGPKTTVCPSPCGAICLKESSPAPKRETSNIPYPSPFRNFHKGGGAPPDCEIMIMQTFKHDTK